MWGNKFGISYVISDDNKSKNQASKYARQIVKSFNQIDRLDSMIMKDYVNLLNNGAYYLPNFFESSSDRNIFNKLKKEIEEANCEITEWSKHHKFENPTFLPTLNQIVDKMKDHFNVDVLHCRLNYYKDETSFKPLHKDQNAYSNIKGDFTMGASFGDTRALEFVHDKTKARFEFPQNNGDVFSFDQNINQQFMHGVPKIKGNKTAGERFSIIAWGKRNI
jgi:hypothetical protein